MVQQTLPFFWIPRPRKLYNIFSNWYRSSKVDEPTVEQILTQYDLGPLQGTRQPAIGPSRSGNVILDVGQGRKVLKLYKSSIERQGIVYEHSVLKHLASREFAAPRLLPTKTGATLVQHKGEHYALFDFVPGFRYSDYFVPKGWAERFLLEAGKTLALYHHAVEGLVPEGRKLDGFMPDRQRRWRERDWYLGQFEQYRERFEAAEHKEEREQFFADSLTWIGRRYDNLQRKLVEPYKQLPKAVIHADYGPHNLLFNREGEATILDFECVQLHLRIIDVGSALKFFAGQGSGFDLHKARVFFEAYSRVYPVTAEETDLMPIVFQAFLLERLPYYFRDYFEFSNDLKLRAAHRTVLRAEWIEAHRDVLVAALT